MLRLGVSVLHPAWFLEVITLSDEGATDRLAVIAASGLRLCLNLLRPTDVTGGPETPRVSLELRDLLRELPQVGLRDHRGLLGRPAGLRALRPGRAEALASECLARRRQASVPRGPVDRHVRHDERLEPRVRHPLRGETRPRRRGLGEHGEQGRRVRVRNSLRARRDRRVCREELTEKGGRLDRESLRDVLVKHLEHRDQLIQRARQVRVDHLGVLGDPVLDARREDDLIRDFQ